MIPPIQCADFDRTRKKFQKMRALLAAQMDDDDF